MSSLFPILEASSFEEKTPLQVSIARDAIPQRGKITLETSNVSLAENESRDYPEISPGNYVLLSVSDTGIGMDEATKNRIFEPFFTTKEKGKGTGLGLSTVYGIVKQSGGSIGVSGDVGKGTIFRLYFPRVDHPVPPSIVEPAIKISTSAAWQTILLVDDNEAVRDVLASILSMRGYKIIVASDGRDALEKFNNTSQRIDLLITDMVMPNMSGVELAQAISEKSSKVKVLFMSGYSEEAIQHQGMLVPGAAFLTKPLTTQLLMQKIDELFNSPAEFRIVRSKHA